ncbi:MAG: hypothetical protein IJE78_11090 [Bacteroidaceae bacterium]|nr:hypothetical protein [Bacteroidaceae bacterium]
MKALKQYLNSDLDLSMLGLNRGSEEGSYFCTPLGAKVIGWAGVDGIHYCTIEGQGETIFAVSPMNFGDYIHPIAESFDVLLRMLLSCHSIDAMEQCYAWAEDQFTAFLIDYPATAEIQEKQDQIREIFKLDPMDDVFGYIKQLQDNYDLSGIRYSEEYYETLGIELPAFEEEEWIVTFDGGFWSNDGTPGKEIRVEKRFSWCEEKWYIPAIYLCDEGIVVDYCKEAECAAIKAFIDKWDLLNEHKNQYSKEQRQQIVQEQPLNANVHVSAIINSQMLREKNGYGLSWVPSALLPSAARDNDVTKLMDHYELDTDIGWSINRCCIPWGDEKPTDIHSMELCFEPSETKISGLRFVVEHEGDNFKFIHPITGTDHVLTVQEIESKELSQTHFQDETMEYPRFFKAMTYMVEPDIDRNHMVVLDCADGDSARPKKNISREKGTVSASSIGVIGRASGPVGVILGNAVPRTLHAACSAVRFDPVDSVEWRIVFREKLKEDVQIKLF